MRSGSEHCASRVAVGRGRRGGQRGRQGGRGGGRRQEERRTRQEEAEEEEQEEQEEQEEEAIDIKSNNPHLAGREIYNNNYMNKNYQKYIYIFVCRSIYIYLYKCKKYFYPK